MALADGAEIDNELIEQAQKNLEEKKMKLIRMNQKKLHQKSIIKKKPCHHIKNKEEKITLE